MLPFRGKVMKKVIILLLLSISLLSAKEKLRVVSLGVSVTSHLFLLESGHTLVGHTSYCKVKNDGVKREVVGSIIKTNVEKVVSLRPDIVFAIGLTPPKTRKELQKMGIKVIVLNFPKSYTMLLENFMTVAKAVGKEEKGHMISQQGLSAMEKIKKKTAHLSRKKIFLQISTKPIFTVVKNSLINEGILISGGQNIFEPEKNGQVSREAVVAKNPEALVIASMGGESKSEKKKWETFSYLSATKNKQIFVIDSEKICSPNPLVFVSAVKELAQFLHPELSFEDE